ncbi:MAG: SpoIID/LytB domain-containing protein [Bacteroidales bacterium]|jgi:SpoIID/LytB domain protein|nr:SpoIID/LytB domain-containing protein [Bacteroidales bacterium]MBP8678178.1 SpoIID/LytB domain-containing protein [Bacteroidales bacterium]MBP9584506.1 SpoIID/LytB domain-containing protein [Bacteroidales bacterium]MBP9979196.1 SpoIID/LytB domain-containing protein [Bacteroidales bacterium]
MREPKVSVGIMFEPRIDFLFTGSYLSGGRTYSGLQRVTEKDGKVEWNGNLYDELLFEPADEMRNSFELRGVTIGINFHWERKENQSFRGSVMFIVENSKVTAINILGVEEYLTSVISSEMSATASLELLKAHAVISRSWLLAQIDKNEEITASGSEYSTMKESEDELIRWYDREDHTRFDICADDHCQRYQGITRASTAIVRAAIEQTRGELLMYNRRICDARYSKSCGGVFEEFHNCWEEKDMPYLVKQRDSKTETAIPDLTIEENAREWILSSPESFCNTTDKKVLSQVLNNYDQETVHFYRWEVKYSASQLSDLIRRRSGTDYGDILDLIPVERGTSGRLVKLKIVGSKKSRTIGKELEIRRTLSESHLYSSAFVVEKSGGSPDKPEEFILKGAGWGHGVGLCQIGAAVMGEKGFKYNEILTHYFPGASVEKRYQ